MICDDMMKMFLKINLSYLIRIDILDMDSDEIDELGDIY
jgi:hypothetical protein